jgi:type III restriction enzyme
LSLPNSTEGLQKEYEEDGFLFEIFDNDTFATIVVNFDDITGDKETLGIENSTKLITEFKDNGYIDDYGKATDCLRMAIKNEDIRVSEQFKDIVPQILEVTNSKTKSLKIKNASEKVEVKVIKEALPENFIKLWDKIKYKTTYRIDFNSEELISNAVNGTSSLVGIKDIQTHRATYLYKRSAIKMDVAGIVAKLVGEYNTSLTPNARYQLPDIITYLQNETSLTRKTIVAILQSTTNLDQFKNNPLIYMNQAAKIINKHKNQLIVDGIKYTKIDDAYEQFLFTSETVNAYLGVNGNSVEADKNKAKTLYEYIVTDSEVEREFARKAELD